VLRDVLDFVIVRAMHVETVSRHSSLSLLVFYLPTGQGGEFYRSSLFMADCSAGRSMALAMSRLCGRRPPGVAGTRCPGYAP